MSEKNISSLPFESSDSSEQQLWTALGDLPRGEPKPALRRAFYDQLEQASSQGWFERVRGWLGISNNAGWVTATACLLIGFGAARMLEQQNIVEPTRLAALEESVALLNRELILDRMQDEATGTRLQGVYDAGYVVQEDKEVAQALLLRATRDPSSSVRSAAIDALGPQLTSTNVGNELMSLLESADSPLVQLALVDMVLRNGSTEQLEHLLRLADESLLYPDLVKHVQNSLRRESI